MARRPARSIASIGCAAMSGDDAELEVGERADGERHLLARQPLDQSRVLERAVAMVEPVDLQNVERLVDIIGRTFLAGMGDALQPERGGRREDPRELRRRMAELGGIEPDRLDPVEPGLRLLQRRERGLLVEMAQEAEDQLRGDAVPRLGLVHAGEQAAHHRVERDAAVGVGLRIEEDLGMDDVVGRRAVEIGEGEVAEIRPRSRSTSAP